MSGAHRAAALLLTMGQGSAARLLKHLDPDEVRHIMRAAATLGVVDSRSIAGIIDQFAEELAEGPKLIGDVSQAQALGAASLTPEEVSDIITSFSEAPEIDVWAELAAREDSHIAKVVENEPAQIAAVMLGRLDSARAARVCGLLPETDRADILSKLYAMRPLTIWAIRRLEDALKPGLAAPPAAEPGENPGSRVANIVNRLEPDEIESVLRLIAEEQQAQADALRALIFTFNDIARLSSESISTLFDQIPTERVVLAMHGAEATIVEKVLARLGARARRMVESELASGQAVIAREVSAARRFICDAALRLAQDGLVELPGVAESQDKAP